MSSVSCSVSWSTPSGNTLAFRRRTLMPSQRSLLPPAWIERMRQPQALAPFYGWLNWLNPQGKSFPGASESSQFMFGAGGNYVWIEPAHQAVVVVRWIDPAHFPGFVNRMARALADFNGGR